MSPRRKKLKVGCRRRIIPLEIIRGRPKSGGKESSKEPRVLKRIQNPEDAKVCENIIDSSAEFWGEVAAKTDAELIGDSAVSKPNEPTKSSKSPCDIVTLETASAAAAEGDGAAHELNGSDLLFSDDAKSLQPPILAEGSYETGENKNYTWQKDVRRRAENRQQKEGFVSSEEEKSPDPRNEEPPLRYSNLVKYCNTYGELRSLNRIKKSLSKRRAAEASCSAVRGSPAVDLNTEKESGTSREADISVSVLQRTPNTGRSTKDFRTARSTAEDSGAPVPLNTSTPSGELPTVAQLDVSPIFHGQETVKIKGHKRQHCWGEWSFGTAQLRTMAAKKREIKEDFDAAQLLWEKATIKCRESILFPRSKASEKQKQQEIEAKTRKKEAAKAFSAARKKFVTIFFRFRQKRHQWLEQKRIREILNQASLRLLNKSRKIKRGKDLREEYGWLGKPERKPVKQDSLLEFMADDMHKFLPTEEEKNKAAAKRAFPPDTTMPNFLAEMEQSYRFPDLEPMPTRERDMRRVFYYSGTRPVMSEERRNRHKTARKGKMPNPFMSTSAALRLAEVEEAELEKKWLKDKQKEKAKGNKKKKFG